MTRTALAALLLAGLAACEPVRTADYLQISFDGPAQADITCSNGGCSPAENTATVTVFWQDDPLFLAEDTIEIAQYRVDYAIPGIEGEVPFFAGYTSQFLNPGATVSFEIVPFGQTQRDLVASTIGPGETVIASATLTLGGYGPANEIIGDNEGEAQAPFELWLSDFTAATATGPTASYTTTTP